MVGHRWSAKSFEVRDFLARNSVPYRWLSSEEPEGQRLLAAAGVDATAIPLVVTPAGERLVDPGIGDLAARVGLSTTPAIDFYDVVIVGGGPAGAGRRRVRRLRGFAHRPRRAAGNGRTGGTELPHRELPRVPGRCLGYPAQDRARRQAHKFGAEILTTCDVVGLEVRASSRAVRFDDDGGEVVAHAVLLATGVSYRKLAVPGADGLTGRGMFYGAATTQGPHARATRSTSSAAPTRRARRRSSWPAMPGG